MQNNAYACANWGVGIVTYSLISREQSINPGFCFDICRLSLFVNGPFS